MSAIVAMFVGGVADGQTLEVPANRQEVHILAEPDARTGGKAWETMTPDPRPHDEAHAVRQTYVRVNDPALEASTGYVFFTHQTSSAE